VHHRRTTNRQRARTRRILGLSAVSILVTIGVTSCDGAVAWKLGKTHGAIIEPVARRASLGIYREPSRALYKAYKRSGTKAAQDILWAVGEPPVASISVDGLSISTAVLNRKMKGYVYGDAADFRGALIDAHVADDCLALTLISQGLYIKNWTHKDVGCRTGSTG